MNEAEVHMTIDCAVLRAVSRGSNTKSLIRSHAHALLDDLAVARNISATHLLTRSLSRLTTQGWLTAHDRGTFYEYRLGPRVKERQ